MNRPILRLSTAPPKPPTPREDLGTIVARWPRAFTRKPRPLALGVRDAIASALGWEPARVGRALLRWTDRPIYLRACTAGAIRVDLYGRETGTVAPGHAAWAAQRAELKTTARKENANAA